MLDVHQGARADEKFHLQSGPPVPHVTTIWGLVRRVTWSNLWLADGQTPGRFQSVWLFGNAIKWYTGTTKCDGTRTRNYWAGRLDDGIEPRYVPNPTQYVMTTTPKEMLTLRFFTDPNNPPTWDTMGGS